MWLAINSRRRRQAGRTSRRRTREAAKTWALAHPILLDETGAVGKAYGATNTPHMFVIDNEGHARLRGRDRQLARRRGQVAEGGKLVNYVDAALDELAAGKPVAAAETKAYGCGVKYGS